MRQSAPPMAPSSQVPVSRGDSSEDASSDGESGSGSESEYSGEFLRSPSMLAAAEKVRKSFSPPAPWMLITGMVLAACAGTVNVASLLEIGAVVSHMTGHLSALGLRSEGVRVTAKMEKEQYMNLVDSKLIQEGFDKHLDAAWTSLTIVFSFIFGAFLTGLIIPKNAINFGGKSFYGVALILNAVFVAVGCVLCLEKHFHTAGAAIACGCGLQNAMCTMHLGAVVRTTHVTGTATDIGSTLGRAAMILLRGNCRRRNLSYVDEIELDVDLAKLRVLLSLFLSFFVGCLLGAFGFNHMGVTVMFIPAAITGSMGILYGCFREQLKHAVKRWKVRRLRAQMGLVEAVYEHTHHSGHHHHHRSHHIREPTEEEEEEQVRSTLEMLHDIQSELCEWAEGKDTHRHESEARLRNHSSRAISSGRQISGESQQFARRSNTVH